MQSGRQKRALFPGEGQSEHFKDMLFVAYGMFLPVSCGHAESCGYNSSLESTTSRDVMDPGSSVGFRRETLGNNVGVKDRSLGNGYTRLRALPHPITCKWCVTMRHLPSYIPTYVGGFTSLV